MRLKTVFIIIIISFTISRAVFSELKFLKVEGRNIVDEDEKRLSLKGVNLGGYLLIEGYLIGFPFIPEKEIRRRIEEKLGKDEKDEFFKKYREDFISEEDIKVIKSLGFNVVRLPFNFRVLEDVDKPFVYKEEGFKIIDRLLNLCEKYKIYVILDLHAAPGGQNPDFHSDSEGEALLWYKKIYQERVVALWREIARRYKDKRVIAGYDLLNEPVTFKFPLLQKLYREITKAIREVDKEHIIFLEGNFWASDLRTIGEPFDDNLVYNFHFYYPWLPKHPDDFSYPGSLDGIYCDKHRLEEILKNYVDISMKYNLPLICTEFGTWRWDRGGEEWVKDSIELFNKYNIHWTYWTYKQIDYYGMGVVYTEDRKVKKLEEMKKSDIFRLNKREFKVFLKEILESVKLSNSRIRKVFENILD